MDKGTDKGMATGRSWWQVFRKRVAPLIFLGVLVLLGTRTCRSEPTRLTVEIDVGANGARMRSLSAEFFREGDPERIAHMTLDYGRSGAAGPARQELQLDRGTYLAAIAVVTDAGPKQFERRFFVESQKHVRIKIDLDNP